MQRQMDELKSKSRTEIERLQFELQDAQELNKQREEDLEQTLKERDEEIKSLKNQFEKEIAIFK